ncbi:F-box/LRR-repeat protein 6-like [Babylonia areolata]|uniref:F-box/LRR-repeat protein 6-like n=1 Tax=Babylonia areolata TaxID=304850 RepID=UPI003FD01FF2
MRRPVTRSRSKALEESRCNLCCREIVAMKPLTESNANGKKPKSRLRNVACTSLIPRDIFDAGIMKKWNSDDSDSDSESRQPPRKKMKVSKSSKGGKKQKDKEGKNKQGSEPSVFVDLPDEIWLKIFKFLLASGQYPTMHRLQLVCRRWYFLSRHCSLWRSVDLSCAGTRWIPYRDSSLEWLSKHRLHPLQKINLHGWHCLTSEGVEHLAKHCPKLRTVELAFCSNITRDAIFHLTTHCKDLSRLKLANTTSDVVCVYPMVHLAESTGLKLRSLDLSGNLLRGFNTVMNALCENCPNLQELDVGRCRGDLIHMDVETWQHSLPNLRLFSLSYSIFQTVQVPPPTRASPGWPKLHTLLLAMSSSGGTKVPPRIDDALLTRFLSNSSSLQRLDVRGCQEVSATNLLALTLPSIKSLELGVFSDAEDGGLEKLLDKYGPQLQEVNLSWTTYSQPAIRAAVRALVRAPSSRMRLLFLARTPLTTADVVEVVQSLPLLGRIELKDCPHLPPDWCKLFNSDCKMKRLHKLVRSYLRKERERETAEEAREGVEEEGGGREGEQNGVEEEGERNGVEEDGDGGGGDDS